MLKKGTIIPVKNLEEWKKVLKTIEEQTDYIWCGAEGLPTNMSDSAFKGYSRGDCAILIPIRSGNKIMQYGSLSEMSEQHWYKGYEVVPPELTYRTVKRF